MGRVCFYRGHHLEHAFGNFTARLRANDSIVDPEYLFWCLHQLHLTGRTAQYQRHTSGIRNLETKRYLTHEISVPPLDEQRRIIGILNRAARIERLRMQAADRLHEFIPALFIKMFGDPVENPMEWEAERIGKLGSVGSGAGFPKREQGVQGAEIPFLKVSDMNLPGNESSVQSWNNSVPHATQTKLRAKIFPNWLSYISENWCGNSDKQEEENPHMSVMHRQQCNGHHSGAGSR